MIELNPRLFTRAAQKAANVQPAVEKHGARYHVSRADGGRAVVRFVPRNNALWCECDCPAGTPQSRQQPVPCYHVAAVLLFENATKLPESLDVIAHDHRDRDYWTGGAYAVSQ